MVIQLPLVSTI